MARVKGKYLKFISQIKRDGSGTVPVEPTYVDLIREDVFDVNCLSITEGTYIANGFNSFVVKVTDKEALEGYRIEIKH